MSEQRRTSTQIRFDSDVHERLVAEAAARQVSINWTVNRLVREGLERLVPADEMRLTRPPDQSDVVAHRRRCPDHGVRWCPDCDDPEFGYPSKQEVTDG